jgi:hypothetical protein
MRTTCPFSKKLRRAQYADDGFFALLGNNGHLDRARLDVEYPISLFALGVDGPAFTVLLYRFSGPDYGQKSLRIERSLCGLHKSLHWISELKIACCGQY